MTQSSVNHLISGVGATILGPVFITVGCLAFPVISSVLVFIGSLLLLLGLINIIIGAVNWR